MEEGPVPGLAPRPPAWLLPVLLGLALLLSFLDLQRPFHADEAGQWSLAVEGEPHSATRDRFHGPALGLATRAAYAVLGADLAEAAPAGLRAVPLAFGLSLVLIPWVVRLPGAWGNLAAALAVAAVPVSGRFIQEPLMAAGLAWAAALWVRAGPAGATAPRLLSGLCAGFALACKITAALHLGLAALALLVLRGCAPGWRGFGAFATGAVFAWVSWQSSFLADLPALGTWWGQFLRAFGVASGLAEPPLPMGSPLPWLATGGLVAAALALRLGIVRSERSPWDFLLLAAALAYLVHLALPYKTPWLLMAPDAVLLALALPALLGRARLRLSAAAAVAVGLAAGLLSGPSRHDYVETRPDVPILASVLLAAGEDRPALVLVQGDHAWPLPFYLRDLRVAYGAVPDAAQADLWLLQAAGPEPPRAQGRRAVPFAMRENELWWALAREPLAGRIETALRTSR